MRHPPGSGFFLFIPCDWDARFGDFSERRKFFSPCLNIAKTGRVLIEKFVKSEFGNQEFFGGVRHLYSESTLLILDRCLTPKVWIFFELFHVIYT